jgi:polar amino acid transport system permease protein
MPPRRLTARTVRCAAGSPARALRWLVTVYVEILRGISALVLLFYLFFILPLFGIRLSPMTTGVIGLGLTFSAYGSEIVRSALANVSRGQRDAVRALDFDSFTALQRIILPQALKPMLPILGNYLIGMFKETPLLAVITIPELFQATKQIAEEIADRVLFMEGGKILADGSAREILVEPADERTRRFLNRVEQR